MHKSKNSVNRLRVDFCVKLLSAVFLWLLILVLLAFIVFIFASSIPGIKAYGFKNVFLTSSFDIFNRNNPTAGIWFPVIVTLITTAVTTLIAAVLGVRVALFLRFRTNRKLTKYIRVIIDLLAGIPSVIFGVFCLNTLAPFLGNIFNITSNGTLLSASIVLSFMILPTIVAHVYHAASFVNTDFLFSSIALGNSRTHAIHKIVKKKIRLGIVIAIITGLMRILCETSALNMMLPQINYDNEFHSGFFGVLLSGLKPLGVIISGFFTSDAVSPATHSVLFAFGIVLFLIVMIVNSCALHFTRSVHSPRYSRLSLLSKKIISTFWFLPNLVALALKKGVNRHNWIANCNSNGTFDVSNFVRQRIKTNWFRNFYTFRKIISDYFIAIITLCSVSWILLDVVINGFIAVFSSGSTVFSNHGDSTGRAFINTLVMVCIAMMFSLPISLLVAIYLSEFAKTGKWKYSIVFFIDSLSSSPSILFGLFGLVFFIQTLGLTASGTMGNSFIAGTLTITLLILPLHTRGIQVSLENVQIQTKLSSLALGANRWTTFLRITFPLALDSIINSSILVIGRILSETAPLYFTAGLNSSRYFGFLSSAQTLTTRIYAQMFQTNLSKINNAQYSSAFLSILLILLLIFFGQILLPIMILRRARILEWIKDKYRLVRFRRFLF